MLNLKLPKVSGLELLQSLKENDHTRDIPIIVLTASRKDKDLKKCQSLGVSNYILKPVDFEQLFETSKALGLFWLLTDRPL